MFQLPRAAADPADTAAVRQKPGVLDELAAERIKRLETESAELQHQAAALAKEIEELNGEVSTRIS